MLQNKLNSLYSLHMSTANGSLSWLDKVLVPCFDPRAHIPPLAVSYDVNLLSVRFSGAAGSFSSSNSHLCSNSAAPPIPPPPHLTFRHSSAGRYSSARWSTLKWWMENVKHCTRLLLPLSYDVDWHHEDLSLFETLSYFPFPSSSLHFYPPESLEFS